MECRCINDNSHATLRFERKELLADIKGNAFKEWDTMKSEDEHARHMVADICEEGNIERVTRVLDLAFSHAVELCLPYTKKWVKPHSSRDNEYEEDDEYVLVMVLPASFSETTLTLLERLVHDMMLSSVLADWLEDTKPEIAARWSGKANAMETEIVSALAHRCAPITRKISPI